MIPHVNHRGGGYGLGGGGGLASSTQGGIDAPVLKNHSSQSTNEDAYLAWIWNILKNHSNQSTNEDAYLAWIWNILKIHLSVDSIDM